MNRILPDLLFRILNWFALNEDADFLFGRELPASPELDRLEKLLCRLRRTDCCRAVHCLFPWLFEPFNGPARLTKPVIKNDPKLSRQLASTEVEQVRNSFLYNTRPLRRLP